MNQKKKQEPDYLVGYGRPPQHSRFKKGQSGNPTGRRHYTQTARAQQLAQQELHRKLTVREGGKTLRMPAIQAIFRKQVLLAVQGNVSATKEILKIWPLAEASDPVATQMIVSWLPAQDPPHAQPIHKIERVIVDPKRANE